MRIAGDRVVATGHGAPPHTADEHVDEGILVPGLVDAQVNGAFGHDVAEAGGAEMADIAQRLPRTGVTAWVPTFVTAPVEQLADRLRRYRALRAELARDDRPRARLLPAHVEGPFLAPTRSGAHRAEWLCEPTPPRVALLVDAGGEDLGYLTLAPELPHAEAAVTALVDAGVRVSLGHSEADAATVHRAADLGARLVTHLFNAQSPLHHRAPGVVGAALADDRLTLGLIVDLHHVAADAVRVAFAAAPGRVMIVTDAVASAGMPPGEYRLGGVDLVVQEGQPPRRADGVLAGSGARMDESIGRAVSVGVDLVTAVRAATAVPARALGHTELGELRPGALADMTVLDGTRCAAVPPGSPAAVARETPASPPALPGRSGILTRVAREIPASSPVLPGRSPLVCCVARETPRRSAPATGRGTRPGPGGDPLATGASRVENP
nr:N-acetylglucosamine-6-phosphate deacetylase [Ornithinimicrobium sediminis]